MYKTFVRQLIAYVTLTVFVLSSVPLSYAQSVLNLPQPGSMVSLSKSYSPAVLCGIKVDPKDPFKFDFLVDPGQSELWGDDLKEESTKLIKYFLASMTIPDKDMWVNLSPYENDRIIPNVFGLTEMGRDLLAQDYILKQITSSLMYPESDLGKVFWQKIYKSAFNKYGTTDVPLDTFNKVWITPDKAEVYEDNGVAFIGESHLKVMLETDYLAVESNVVGADLVSTREQAGIKSAPTDGVDQGDADIAKSIIREVMIPVIEKEVNEGKNFAQLRQVYQSLILATWYKKRLKDSILSQVYMDKNKTAGVDVLDKDVKKKIYAQYLEAFKKGAYNYIKEEYDQYTQEMLPRKYFSGGVEFAQKIDDAMTIKDLSNIPGKLLMRALIVVSSIFSVFGLKGRPANSRSNLDNKLDLEAYLLANKYKNTDIQEVFTMIEEGGGSDFLKFVRDPEQLMKIRQAVRREMKGKYPNFITIMKIIDDQLLRQKIDYKKLRDSVWEQKKKELLKENPLMDYPDFHRKVLVSVHILDDIELIFIPDDVPLYRVIDNDFIGKPNTFGKSYWGVGSEGIEVAMDYKEAAKEVIIMTTFGAARAAGFLVLDQMAVRRATDGSLNALELHHLIEGYGDDGKPLYKNVQYKIVDAAGKSELKDLGGIDMNAAALNLSVKGDGSAAVNAMGPVMLEQFRNAPGLIPVIINIAPVSDLSRFLGISKAFDAASSQASI